MTWARGRRRAGARKRCGKRSRKPKQPGIWKEVCLYYSRLINFLYYSRSYDIRLFVNNRKLGYPWVVIIFLISSLWKQSEYFFQIRILLIETMYLRIVNNRGIFLFSFHLRQYVLISYNMYYNINSARTLCFYFDCVQQAIGWRVHVTLYIRGRTTVQNHNINNFPKSQTNTEWSESRCIDTTKDDLTNCRGRLLNHLFSGQDCFPSLEMFLPRNLPCFWAETFWSFKRGRAGETAPAIPG